MDFDRSATAQNEARAQLYGLVLAGGGSTRMGTDKGQLIYSGEPQVVVALRLVERFCAAAYVSLSRPRPGYADLPVITDVEPDRGPAGALLSGWQRFPDVAWLTVAVDMPLLDARTLSLLVESRDSSRIATAFRHADGTLEPLCAIWEPAAHSIVRAELDSRRGSLRSVLERSEILPLDPPEPSTLESVDERSRYRILRDRLSARASAAERDR